MSQENVKLVLAAYEWGSQQRELDLGEVFERDFEWHTREDLPDAGVRRGHEGLVRLRAEWVDAFEDFHVDVDELIDAGENVIAVTRLCGCLRDSGQELDLQEAQVWRMRNGKAAEVRAYLTRSEALKAVGLEESAMSQENVEAMRRRNATFNRGDIAGACTDFHPAVEYRDLQDPPDVPEKVRGISATRDVSG